jgi:integrase
VEGRAAAKTFFDQMEDYLQKYKLSDVREKNFRVLIRALKRYELFVQLTDRNRKCFKLDIETIDKDVIEDFESFLRNEHTLLQEYPDIFKLFPANTDTKRKSPAPKPRGDNTICALFNKLRAFFNWCNKQKLTQNRPFLTYDGITTEKYGTPYYLTLEERNRIADFDLSNHPQLAIQRDVFIFQCLIGCRVSDLLKMTRESVINDAVEYIPHKVISERPLTVRVPLNDRAKALIKKYKGMDKQGMLFPFISEQKYNKDIKKIFTLCEVNRLVTIQNPTTGGEEKRPLNEIASSHLARRTFVGNLYKHVKDPNLVGSLSGHAEGSKAFARYRDIDEEMKTELVKMLE